MGQWLMEWLTREAKLQAAAEGEENETTMVLKEIESLVEGLISEHRVMSLVLEKIQNQIDQQRRSTSDFGSARTSSARELPDTSQFGPSAQAPESMQLIVEAMKDMSKTIAELTTRMDSM